MLWLARVATPGSGALGANWMRAGAKHVRRFHGQSGGQHGMFYEESHIVERDVLTGAEAEA